MQFRSRWLRSRGSNSSSFCSRRWRRCRRGIVVLLAALVILVLVAASFLAAFLSIFCECGSGGGSRSSCWCRGRLWIFGLQTLQISVLQHSNITKSIMSAHMTRQTCASEILHEKVLELAGCERAELKPDIYQKQLNSPSQHPSCKH